MQTIARAATRSGKTGQPLPDVYQNLADVKTKFRRGGCSMIAGPPGSYKSTFALNLLIKWAEMGLTAFYCSADSDELTVAKRCAAIISGDNADRIEHNIKAYTRHLNKLTDVRWAFKALDMQGLDYNLQVFRAMYGHFPDVIFIDNLMNCVSGPADFQGQITMTRDLDTLARTTRSHVVILHHTQEHPPARQGPGQPAKSPYTPPPRWEIQGKVSQFPRLILTVNCINEHLMVATCKNTNGPQQADGGKYEDFIVDNSNYRIVEVARHGST